MLGLAFRVWNLMTTCELGTRRTNFLGAHRTLKGFARTLEGAVTHRHPWKWWRWRLQITGRPLALFTTFVTAASIPLFFQSLNFLFRAFRAARRAFTLGRCPRSHCLSFLRDAKINFLCSRRCFHVASCAFHSARACFTLKLNCATSSFAALVFCLSLSLISISSS